MVFSCIFWCPSLCHVLTLCLLYQFVPTSPEFGLLHHSQNLHSRGGNWGTGCQVQSKDWGVVRRAVWGGSRERIWRHEAGWLSMAFQCAVCEGPVDNVKPFEPIWLYVCQLVSDCLKNWQFFVCFNFWPAILGATRFRLCVWSPKSTIREFEADISFGVKGASELESISSFHCNFATQVSI